MTAPAEPPELSPGSPLRHPSGSRATLGCFVTNGEWLGLLSTATGIAPPRASEGDYIHGLPLDATDTLTAATRVARLTRHFTPILTTVSNHADAAVAQLLPGIRVTGNRLPDSSPIDGVLPPDRLRLGMRVSAVGATSGVMHGTITAVDMTNLRVQLAPRRFAHFDGCVEISPAASGGPFSRPGDAGALVHDEAGNALGLVFAGSEAASYVLPIAAILERFGLTFAAPS